MKIFRLFLVFIFLILSSVAIAQSSSVLKRRKEAIQREILLLQKNLKRAASGKKITLSQINILNAKIGLMQNKITVINKEIRNLDQEIHRNKNDVYSLQDRLSDLKEQYAAMIRFAQRNENSCDKMMFVFASDSFNQAYKRLKYLKQFGNYRKKQAGYIQGTQKDLNFKIVVLDNSLKVKNNLLSEQEQERIRLDQNKSEQAEVLIRLSKQEKRFKQDIDNKKRQQAKINSSYRNAISRELAIEKRKAAAAARAKAARAAQLYKRAAAKAKAEHRPVPASRAKNAAAYLASTPKSTKLSAGFERNKGSLPWPVAAGSITETFGKHKQGQASYVNSGVTITTAKGSTVRAVFSGQVTKVGSLPGGYYVLIKHGIYFTVYQNLRSLNVAAGTQVNTRQSLGIVASSGSISELQFQIYRGTVPQNPSSWISK
jgi:septal ring factor EnvC (AmiA/AmiB activator)